MRRLIRFSLLTTLVTLIGLACSPAAHALGHGRGDGPDGRWQLIAGPSGSTVRGALGPIYTFQAGDRAYEALPAAQPLSGGRGYWAYLPADATIDGGDAGAPCEVKLPTGAGWVLIGDPSSTRRAIVLGDTPLALADVLVYDAAHHGYTSVLKRVYSESGAIHEITTADLEPGQAAWARLRADGGSITVDGCPV